MAAVKDAGRPDRSPDYDALSRRSLRRDGRIAGGFPSAISSITAPTCSQVARWTTSNKTYTALYAKGKHTVAKPGDKVSITGLDWRIVESAGEPIKMSLPGAGKPNPYCAAFKPQDVDRSENAQSVGSHVTFGKFRVLHMGDLTVNKEFDLMCPTNRLGTVDLWVVSHHGQAISNSEVLVHAIQPRVAI